MVCDFVLYMYVYHYRLLCFLCLCVGNGEYEGDGYEGSEQVNALFMMLQLQLSTEAFTAFSTLVLLSRLLLLYVISTWSFLLGLFLTVFNAIWPFLWFDVFTAVWQHSRGAWVLRVFRLGSTFRFRFRLSFTLIIGLALGLGLLYVFSLALGWGLCLLSLSISVRLRIGFIKP